MKTVSHSAGEKSFSSTRLVRIAILKPLLSSSLSPLDHSFDFLYKTRQFPSSLYLHLLYTRPVQSTLVHAWSILDGHWLTSYSSPFWVFSATKQASHAQFTIVCQSHIVCFFEKRLEFLTEVEATRSNELFFPNGLCLLFGCFTQVIGCVTRPGRGVTSSGAWVLNAVNCD